MIYVGHFSSSDFVMDREGEPWHGHFTVVVEARNVATAIRALKRFVTTFAARHDELFEGVQDIYLDACIEIEHLPKAGVLTFITLHEGPDFGGISSVLLGSSRRGVESYTAGPPDDGTGKKMTVEPFVRLRARRRSPVRRAGELLH